MATGAVDLAIELSGHALDAFDGALVPGHGPGWGPLRGPLLALEALAATAPEEDLRSWSERIADPRGELPLLGAGAGAGAYPALLWNGARGSRAGFGSAASLVLVGLAAAGPGVGAAELARAVQGGLAVGDMLESRSHGGPPPVATAGTAAVAAAACAALVRGTDRDALPGVLDLAGSLMLIHPPGRTGVPLDVAGLWGGHALAAGWLAARLPAAGITGMPGGLAHTLATVTGRPVRLDRRAGGMRELLQRRPGAVPVRALLEALT